MNERVSGVKHDWNRATTDERSQATDTWLRIAISVCLGAFLVALTSYSFVRSTHIQILPLYAGVFAATATLVLQRLRVPNALGHEIGPNYPNISSNSRCESGSVI